MTKSEIMRNQLAQYQALPLSAKVKLSKKRIEQWLDHWDDQCYVAFSGGKDSTVLLDLVWSVNPNIPAVFVDTGLEYPEIREFVKSFGNVVTWLKPKMRFDQVIEKYGYPVVSKDCAQKIHEVRTTKSDKLKNKRLFGDDKGNGKMPEKWKPLIEAPFKVSHKCCNALKKSPIKAYEVKTKRVALTGTMATESTLRSTEYIRHGCSSFDAKRPQCKPLSFWSDDDIWQYIRENDVPYSSIYDTGVKRTGCMFCMFGVHLEKGENRFQRMYRTHPKQWDYCINKLGCRKVLDFIGVPYKPEGE